MTKLECGMLNIFYFLIIFFNRSKLIKHFFYLSKKEQLTNETFFSVEKLKKRQRQKQKQIKTNQTNIM